MTERHHFLQLHLLGRVVFFCILSFVECRLSNWRTEMVKCSYLNYQINVSRVEHFCGRFPAFFCCNFEDARVVSKCCTLEEFFAELRLQFIAAELLSWLVLLLLALVALSCFYILIKSSRLLKHVYQKE